jgi:hypothetical protein
MGTRHHCSRHAVSVVEAGEAVLKVHLDPYLISVIENNTNKNLIISMSIKQEFIQPKRRKGKHTPKFMSIQMKGL